MSAPPDPARTFAPLQNILPRNEFQARVMMTLKAELSDTHGLMGGSKPGARYKPGGPAVASPRPAPPGPSSART
jgi:hypothetical protein